jgi:hypothetical protein
MNQTQALVSYIYIYLFTIYVYLYGYFHIYICLLSTSIFMDRRSYVYLYG